MNYNMMIDRYAMNQFEAVAEPLAEAYKIAFAGGPWNERSKCVNTGCLVQFDSQLPGCNCYDCGDPLQEAYSSREVIDGWRTMLEYDDAVMEVTSSERGIPYLATIARPTTPEELFKRKYADVPAMQEWLSQNLEEQFIWIEDTFANREISPRRNLDRRGVTLARIALRYDQQDIVTRTLAPAVIKATLRDMGDCTELAIGNRGIGADLYLLAQITTAVPDDRTMLRIGTV